MSTLMLISGELSAIEILQYKFYWGTFLSYRDIFRRKSYDRKSVVVSIQALSMTLAHLSTMMSRSFASGMIQLQSSAEHVERKVIPQTLRLRSSYTQVGGS